MAAAYTDFCCRSGGSNLNAGTRTGNTTVPGTGADLTYASGTWVQSTGVFTVASGNPTSDGVAVGDWASVYPDGSTTGVFVGRVTARGATTITVSLSAKAGTAPTDGTNTRTLKIGGAWQGPTGTDGFPFTLGNFSNFSNSSSDPPFINFKDDQTTSTTATIAHSNGGNQGMGGFTTAYRDGGYASWRGPTTGASFTLLNLTGTLWRFQYMDFAQNGDTGSSALVICTGGRCIVHRVKVHDCVGIGLSIGSNNPTECEGYGCNQSNTAALSAFAGTDGGSFIRCDAHDNTGSNSSGFTGDAFFYCIADSNGSHGIIVSTNNATTIAKNNTCYGNGGAGINHSGTGDGILLENNLLVNNSGTAGIVGPGNQPINLFNNAYFGNAAETSNTGKVVLEEGSVTLSADPFIDAANRDFDLNTTAGGGLACKAAGRGGFIGSSLTSGSPDIGASQSSGSGSAQPFGGLIVA